MYNTSLNLNLKLTINQMLMSNLHIGHTKKFLNISIKPYLLGIRNNVHILNIAHTPFQFKLLVNIIINLVSLRQNILIVKDRDVFNFRELLNLSQIFYYDKKWIGGSLTNFRKVRQSPKFKEDNDFYNSLGSMRYMPSLIFFFDIDLSRWAAMEASNLEIPIASIIDSNVSLLNHVNFPVLGNNKAFEALFLYLNVIINSVLKGKQKELLKILSII
jgi:small subunit ribosomal protein S2